jgi:hypothetical protein
MAEPEFCRPEEQNPNPNPTNTEETARPFAKGVQLNTSSLCDQALTRSKLTGYLCDVIKRFFQKEQNIPSPYSELIWTPNTTTGIRIATSTQKTDNIIGKLPAVIVKAGEMRVNPLAIGDVAGYTQEGFIRRIVQWVGSHTIFAIHGNELGCETIAGIIASWLQSFRIEIIRDLRLDKFSVIQVGAASEIEESSEVYAIPIVLNWSYQQQWLVQEESRVLKKIITDAEINYQSYRFSN